MLVYIPRYSRSRRAFIAMNVLFDISTALQRGESSDPQTPGPVRSRTSDLADTARTCHSVRAGPCRSVRKCRCLLAFAAALPPSRLSRF